MRTHESCARQREFVIAMSISDEAIYKSHSANWIASHGQSPRLAMTELFYLAMTRASLTNSPKEDILKKGNARFSFGRLHSFLAKKPPKWSDYGGFYFLISFYRSKKDKIKITSL